MRKTTEDSDVLIKELLNFADEFDMLPNAGLVLVCVSGGADSMCLLEALLEISAARGFIVGAAHYNHHLRGAESERDEAFVREYCTKQNVPLYCGGGDVRGYAKANGFGIEEAARKMRYAFFRQTANATGAVRIATAHTADDNAETVIMNLTRGAGTAGLSGIPPVRDFYIRPMLTISRKMVLEFLSERHVPYVDDSTNSLDIYTRNKVRKNVIPVLKEINPRFLDSISSLTALLRSDNKYLSDAADYFIRGHCDSDGADIDEVLRLPEAVAGRVVRKISGVKLSAEHVSAVLKMCAGEKVSARLNLPGITAFREYNRLHFGVPHLTESFEPVYPSISETIIIPELGLKMTCKMVECGDTINKSFTSFLFKYVDLCGKITVRPRRTGDAIRLYGRFGTKSLQKLFIEHRIPREKRERIPIIADDDGVLAVYGIGAGERARPKTGDLALKIDFEDVG